MTFQLFQKLMSFDTKESLCIEIFFAVKESDKFDRCWMGKMPSRETQKDIFWYGLTPDGKNAYDYPKLEDFLSADVFDGKSLTEIWNEVEIKSINGCDPSEMIEMYLSSSGGLGSPQ